MHPDVQTTAAQTMAAQARIDQRLRDAVQARLAAQAGVGRRHQRQHRFSGVLA